MISSDGTFANLGEIVELGLGLEIASECRIRSATPRLLSGDRHVFRARDADACATSGC